MKITCLIPPDLLEPLPDYTPLHLASLLGAILSYWGEILLTLHSTPYYYTHEHSKKLFPLSLFINLREEKFNRPSYVHEMKG